MLGAPLRQQSSTRLISTVIFLAALCTISLQNQKAAFSSPCCSKYSHRQSCSSGEVRWRSFTLALLGSSPPVWHDAVTVLTWHVLGPQCGLCAAEAPLLLQDTVP